MTQPFLTALREAFQCAAVLLIVRAYLLSIGGKGFSKPLISGTALALIAGLALGLAPGFAPSLAGRLPSHETWTFFRQLTEIATFYTGFALVVLRPRNNSSSASGAGLFLLGVSIFVFEAEALGSFLLYAGPAGKSLAGDLAAGAAGLMLGFLLPLILIARAPRRAQSPVALTAATLLISIGALRFAFGGLGEFEDPGIVTEIDQGVIAFLDSARLHIQSRLVLNSHRFLAVPFAGLMDSLFGGRAAMALTVIFMTAPPVAALLEIFGKPSPRPRDAEASDENRHGSALSGRDVFYRTAPVAVSLVVIIVILLRELAKGGAGQ